MAPAGHQFRRLLHVMSICAGLVRRLGRILSSTMAGASVIYLCSGCRCDRFQHHGACIRVLGRVFGLGSFRHHRAAFKRYEALPEHAHGNTRALSNLSGLFAQA